MNKPISILFTIPNFITAGSGRVMLNIIERLNRNIFEPAVCVSKKGGKMDSEVEQMGIPFIEAPFTIDAKPYYSLFSRSRHASQKFKPYQFDLWHSWHYIDDYTEAVIARMAGVKAWLYTKKNMSWGSNGWLIRSLLANRIAVDNTEMTNAFFSRLNLKKKIRLIPHGIPTDQFSPDVPPSLGLRQKLGISEKAVVVGCTANLTIRKGHHVLLEAVSKIADIFLITVGRTLEADYVERLEKMRRELRIEDRTFLLGYVENVPALLKEVDIYVLPTWNRGSKEGCPLGLIEAMSSGKACVATDIPGSRDIIEQGVSGFLVPAEDADELAQRIRQLAQDRHLREIMGKEARSRIIQHFSIEKEVLLYEELYSEIVRQ